MNITGELLKTERIKQGLSVQDVALSLKLSSKIISSIEGGRPEELPAKTFVRGFVKSYAQLLKIDVDQVMRQFQEEMGSTHPMPKTPPPLGPPSATQGEPAPSGATHFKKVAQSTQLNNDNSKKTFIYMALAIILIVLIIGVDKIVEKYQRDATIDTNNVAAIKPLNPVAPAAASEENTNLSVPAASPVPADPTVTVTQVQPPTTPVKSSSMTDNLDTSSTVTLAPEEGFEPSAGKPVEIIIEAKKNVELLYAKGNSKNFSKLRLQTKQVQVIRSPDGLHLKAEDGGAVNLIVNGVEKGAAGASNKPVKLTF
ncbi:MAG: helix-turn-helix domain-containing protein [Bdellovibrionaceae bacterium]|nr:helix-turn-helix domain-containing protein [Bdellovibrio sp.]